MQFLLVNTILILCNPAPNPLCQVWLRISSTGEGVGGGILELKIAMNIFMVYRTSKNIKGFVKCFREAFVMKKLISVLGIFLLNLFIFTSLSLALSHFF